MATQKKTPRQHQAQPGEQHKMQPQPSVTRREYQPAGKLKGKVALVTGGDSGIGRSVAHHFALEGALVAFTYVAPKEEKDAKDTVQLLKDTPVSKDSSKEPLAIPTDLGSEGNCKQVVQHVVDHFGRLDVLVNNVAEQHDHKSIEDITADEWDRTFRTNIHAYFFLTKHALKHLQAGSCIINTTSINAYRGHPTLIPYSTTKGAIVAFTRSLAINLASKGIRVNGVAPGPVWTPLIPSTFPEEKVESFGQSVPMGRPGQPDEMAPSYVFLASDDSSYFSGQVLHPNGGVVINA